MCRTQAEKIAMEVVQRKKDKGYRGQSNGRPSRRRLHPEWIKGVKGYFVCGKKHRETTRHTAKKPQLL